MSERPTDVIRIYTGDIAIVEWVGSEDRRFPVALEVFPSYALARIRQWWVERAPHPLSDFHRRILGKPWVAMGFNVRHVCVGFTWSHNVVTDTLEVSLYPLPMIGIIVHLPFRSKVWPYYADGRWYHAGNAPIHATAGYEFDNTDD